MKDYLNYDGLAVMAHRGGSLEAPENTIESFLYSLEIGSDIIETDIQLSSDGVHLVKEFGNGLGREYTSILEC